LLRGPDAFPGGRREAKRRLRRRPVAPREAEDGLLPQIRCCGCCGAGLEHESPRRPLRLRRSALVRGSVGAPFQAAIFIATGGFVISVRLQQHSRTLELGLLEVSFLTLLFIFVQINPFSCRPIGNSFNPFQANLRYLIRILH